MMFEKLIFTIILIPLWTIALFIDPVVAIVYILILFSIKKKEEKNGKDFNFS